jgi:hypothetical protein
MKSIKFKTVLSLCISLLIINCNSTFAAVKPDDISNEVITHLNVSSIQPLPDGGNDYIYNIDGHEHIYHVPPAGFNPLTATDAQLDEYGFPARPLDPVQLEQWKKGMSYYENTPIPDVIQIKTLNSKVETSNSNLSPDFVGDCNWAGYVNYHSSGCSLSEVQGNYTQPTRQTDTLSLSNQATWIGLGGDKLIAPPLNSACLLQIGTKMTNFDYTAVYEYVGADGTNNGPYNIQYGNGDMPINPKDNIYVDVKYYDDGSNKAVFFIADYTSHQYVSTTITNLPQSNYFAGKCSEFIVEKPNDSLPNLCDYYKVFWTNCQTYENGWKNMTDLDYRGCEIQNAMGHILSFPEEPPSSSTSFICDFNLPN